MDVNGTEYRLDYEPAESTTGLFGGNSNWRGPIWFPLNYLLIEALQKYDLLLGAGVHRPVPHRLRPALSPWLRSPPSCPAASPAPSCETATAARRPVYGGTEVFQTDPHWKDHLLFFEYFHGDNGAGLGASHQTGWTGLVAKLIEQSGE